MASGMPAGMGVVPMNQSSVEKNGWSWQIATMLRPVKARASRTAAVVTSEPFLANLTISPVGIDSRKLSAASSSMAAGRAKFVPRATCRVTASTTAGWACPRVTLRRPDPYSMYS